MILDGMPPEIAASIAPATVATLTGVAWFPTTLAHAFMPSLALTFYMGALLSFAAALLCAMRGEKYVHETDGKNGKETETSSPVQDDYKNNRE